MNIISFLSPARMLPVVPLNNYLVIMAIINDSMVEKFRGAILAMHCVAFIENTLFKVLVTFADQSAFFTS